MGRAGAVAAAVALATGCGSGDEDEPQPLPLRALVLQARDLPAGFETFASGPARRPDAAAGRRDDPGRFGRVGGWEASYRRAGGRSTPGPLVVVSRVDAFRQAAGAGRQHAREREGLARAVASRPARVRALRPPRIGEEAAGTVQTGAGAGAPARFFTVAWRQGTLTGTLRVSGFAGRLSERDVLALAHRQQERMAGGRRPR